jgi:hypothetical protein
MATDLMDDVDGGASALDVVRKYGADSLVTMRLNGVNAVEFLAQSYGGDFGPALVRLLSVHGTERLQAAAPRLLEIALGAGGITGDFRSTKYLLRAGWPVPSSWRFFLGDATEADEVRDHVHVGIETLLSFGLPLTDPTILDWFLFAPRAVETLIAHGVDPRHQSRWEPIESQASALASARRRTDVAIELRRASYRLMAWPIVFPDRRMLGETAAHVAVAENEVDVLAALDLQELQQPAKYLNVTPLHCAVILKRPSLVSALIERGVDREAKNSEGFTALDEASFLDDPSVSSLRPEP